MSSKQKRCKLFINYFIQNDSWESISHPNLLILEIEFTNLNDVKAQMVYDNFPLKNKQNFYLRFFLDDKTQGIKGWVDFPPKATIPIYNDNLVYVKVLRLPINVKINYNKNDVVKQKKETSSNINEIKTDNLIFMDDQEPKPVSTQQPNNSNLTFGQDLFSDFNKELNNIGNPNLNSNLGNVQNQKPHQPSSDNIKIKMNKINQNQNTFNINYLKGFEVGNNQNQNEIILDIGSNSQNNSNKNMNQVDQNLFNIFNNININSNQNQNQSMNVPNYDFTANMSQKKNELFPIDKIPNTLPDDDIKDKVDSIIDEWILGGEGKKNLLFLLTTLHEVWTNSKLNIPDMQTLVNDKAAVRTWYKKAMRELHSDKNIDKDFKTKYIASRLYQILNEANSNYQ